MKSYQGSIGISRFLLRSTWKPYAPYESREVGGGPSASSRDIKRLRAPNIVCVREGNILSKTLSERGGKMMCFFLDMVVRWHVVGVEFNAY